MEQKEANTRRCEARVSNWRFRLLLLSLFALLPGCGTSEKAEIKHATLNFDRTSSWFGRACDMDVYVNDRKVGKVGNGKQLSVTFIPNASGRNTVHVELIAVIGPDAKSPETEFQATPGAIVSVTSKIDGWGAKPQVAINLKVQTDKEGVPAVEMLDVSLNPDIVRRAVTSEGFDGPPGSSIKVERSRTIEHTVNVTNSGSLEAGVSAMFGLLTADIKARVSTLTGQSVRTSETKTIAIAIDCTKTPRGEIVWVDHIRTGTARARLNGVEKTIEFEYQESTELTIRPR